MADMRSCIKTGCRWPAVATLAYRYATAEVWLSELGDPHPATHDLCPHHADSLKVPRGWALVDDRNPAEVVREPSAAEIVERVARLRASVDLALEPAPPRRRSRYDDLLDDLPDPPEDAAGGEAAAEAGAATGQPGGAQDGGDGGGGPDEASDADFGLAPTVRELVPAHRSAPDEDDEVDPDAVHETGLRGAVVVQLPLSTWEHHDA